MKSLALFHTLVENDIKTIRTFLETNNVLKSIANESEVSTEADTSIFAAIKQFFKRIGKILVKIWDKLVSIIVKFTDFLGITNIQMNKQIEKLKKRRIYSHRAGDSLIYYMKRSPDENAKLTSLGNSLKNLLIHIPMVQRMMKKPPLNKLSLL